MAFRIDRLPIQKYDLLPSGMLRVVGTIARVGELKYLMADGDRAVVQVEHLTEDELFNERWLDSIANSPLTLGHPSVKVTPENWKQYAVGAVGGVPIPRKDEGMLDFVVTICDASAIHAVQSGQVKELSPGYDVSVVDEGGRLYQRDRIGNHLAIVGQARGGEACKLHLDGVEDFAIQIFDNEPINLDLNRPKLQEGNIRAIADKTDDKRKDQTMRNIPIMGEVFAVDNDNLADAILKVLKEVESKEESIAEVALAAGESEKSDAAQIISKVKELKTSLDQKEGELVGLKTKVDEAEKSRMDADAIATEVKSRIDSWAEVLPALRQVKADYQPDYSLDSAGIRRAYLAIAHPHLKLDGATDDYIQGVWAALKPEIKESVDHVDSVLSDIQTSVRTDMGAKGGYSKELTDRRKKRPLPGMSM